MDTSTTSPYQGLDVTQLLRRYLEKDPLESAFTWSVERVLVPEPPKPPSLLHALHQLFKSTYQEQWTLYVSKLVEYMLTQRNPHRVKALGDVFTTLVSQSVIPPRLVCESVLRQLNMGNQLTWKQGMVLVRNIVGGVDYKGCREIMKLVLDCFDQLPRSIHEKDVNALHSGRELLAYMLGRNAALLPAYIAYDEIKLRYQGKDTHPHWALRDITATLNGSMEVIANIVSGRMLPYLSPVISISQLSSSAWKLDPVKYSFPLQGRLPYSENLYLQQKDYLCQVIVQPNSNDFVLSILSINKQTQPQPIPFVEQCMETLILNTLKKTNDWQYNEERVVLIWSHLASQLLLFSLHHILTANSVLNGICKNIRNISYGKSRHYLVWLLQHYVPVIGAMSLSEDIQTITNLITILYPENEAISIPETSGPQCVFELAAAGVLTQLKKKAMVTNVPFLVDIPVALSAHVEFLQGQLESLSQSPPTIPSWYILTALLNAHSIGTSNDEYTLILNRLVGSLFSSKLQKTPSPNKDEGGSSGTHNDVPLSMDCVGLMVMHTRGRLSDKIKIMITDIVKQPQSVANSSLVTHALLETFSRVLLWCGTKNFQSQLIPFVFKLQSWSVIQLLLEVISYRVHTQLQMSFRFSILQLLHSIAGVTIIPTQLFISAENTALYLIQGLNGFELPLQIAKCIADPKQLFHADSEELNKMLLLVLSQSLHFSRVELGAWLENLLKELEVSHSKSLFLWPESAIPYLPMPIRQHCTFNSQVHPVTMETRRKLITRVEEEHQFLQSKSEAELDSHYNEGDSGQYILCVIWKQLFESNQITPLVSRMLQRLRLSPKKLTTYARIMVDYIIFTCPQPGAPSNSKFVAVVTHLNDLIWKYYFCPLDRLLLCILWRSYGGQEAILSMQLVYQLLMREDVISRVNDFIQMVPPDVWSNSDWEQKHSVYLSHHSECFQVDTSGTGTKVPAMPMFFGNVCLRILPVIDLTLQRLLEKPETYLQLITKLLDKYKPLYKYHQYPVRFLHSLLHYYVTSLAKVPSLRKLLASSILGGLPTESHSMYLTQSFLQFLSSTEGNWTPPPSYWSDLLQRICKGLDPFDPSCPPVAWPLSEFPSGANCRLYATCVEVMSIPCNARTVTNGIINTLVTQSSQSLTAHNNDVMTSINGVGGLFSVLPDMYSECIYAEILDLFKSPPLAASPTESAACSSLFSNTTHLGCMLNVLHAFLHHASVSAIMGFSIWMRTQLKPITNNELQLLYICHMLGPLMNRLASEKPSLLLDLVVELYNFIQKVDQAQEGHVLNCDAICDLLYHIKYKHIGDLKKEEIEKVVTSLHPQLRMRLRFLVHSLTTPPHSGTGVDQPHSAVVTPTSLPSTTGVTTSTTSDSMDTS